MIAALYVRADGPYVGRMDVDPWPAPRDNVLFDALARDARKYDGPHRGVYHPPCARWSQLAHIHKHKPGKAIGEDGGCFAAAIAAVEKWGGYWSIPQTRKRGPYSASRGRCEDAGRLRGMAGRARWTKASTAILRANVRGCTTWGP